MTEQEVGELEARLTRIWGVEISCYMNPLKPAELAYDFGVALIQSSDYAVDISITEDCITLSCGPAYYLIATKESGLLPAGSPLIQGEADFRSRWLDYFRRGCWLCGYDMEASAHEKAQWVEGFTGEEIEAWNLQF